MLSTIGLVVACIAVATGCAAEPSPGPTTDATPTAQASPAPSSDAGAQPLGSAWPEPPQSEVVGLGTVRDAEDAVVLCLGAVSETSEPPLCGGHAIEGWDWTEVRDVRGGEGARWGTYIVRGTWDGEQMTVTQTPVPISLSGLPPVEQPAAAGETSDERLREVMTEVAERLGTRMTSTYTDRGYVWVKVPWDDGTLQAAADAEYGPDVVRVISALEEVV